jgi:hypothetical protein
MTPVATELSVSTSPDDPSPAAVEAYKEAVFFTVAGEGPGSMKLETILDDAWRLQQQFDADCKVYRQRLDSRRVLDVEVPAMEKRVAKLRAAADAVKPPQLREKPLATFATLGELHDALDSLRHQNAPNAMYVSAERERLHQAETTLRSTRQAAVDYLRHTADPTIDNQATEIRRQIRLAEAHVRDRQAAVDLPKLIAVQKRIVKTLAGGVIPPELAGRVPQGGMPAVFREQKERLRALGQRRSEVAGAVAAQKKALAEIQSHNARLAEVQRARLDPRNMRWTD